MKTLALLSVLFTLVFTSAYAKSSDKDIPEYLENIAVKIKVNQGSGSGVAFTRKDWTGTNDITFIWTAAHVCKRSENLFSMLFFGQHGTNTPVIDHVQILLNLYDKDGELCGSTNRMARIIKYSDDENGQDLAILVLDGPYFNTNSVIFDLSGKPKRIGTKVISVASPYGFTDTYSEGNISMVGLSTVDINVFDQTSCVVFPGSSGGGIFDTNGVYIGMITVTAGPNINFMIPMRRIHAWAKREGIEWALDPKIPMPSEKEFKTLNIGDSHRVINSLSPVSPPANTPSSSNKKKQDTQKH